MSSAGEVDAIVTEARQLARLREQLPAQQQQPLARAAERIVAAAREGRAVHLVGEDLCAPLAAYLSELLMHGDEARILPARPLLPAGRDVDALARAVQACVRKGDVVVALATAVSPGLMRAISRTRLRGGTSIALLSENTAHTLACDLALVVPAPRAQVAHELFLALGHALQALVLQGLAALPPEGGESSALEDIPVSQDSFADRVIDRDLDSQLDTPITEDAALLRAAVDSLAAPPTDPRGGGGFAAGRRTTRAPADPRGHDGRGGDGRATVGSGATPAGGASFRFRCGGCERVVTVDPRLAGKRGYCPHCRIEFVIPHPREAAALPPPPPRPGPAVAASVPPRLPEPGQTAPAPQRPRPGATPAGGIPAPWAPQGRQKAPTKERRRATRVSVRDAVLRWEREDFPTPERPQDPYSLDDLSLTGLRFMGPARDLKVGDIVHLALDFPAYPDPVRVKAQVRRVTAESDPAVSTVGVRFVQWVGDAEVRVRRLVENVQLRSVRRR